MVLDAYKKEADKATAPAIPDKPERTLKAVLADKTDSALFGKMLETDGDFELSIRLAQGKLTPDDVSTLDEKRKTFLDKLETAKETVKSLDPAMVSQIAEQSPEFKTILALAGPEATAKVLQRKVHEYMFSRPDEFKNIADQVEMYTAYKNGVFKDLDDVTTDLLKLSGINENAFVKIMQNPDQRMRIDELRQEARSALSGWRYGLDFVTGGRLANGSRNWARELSGKKGEIDTAIQEMAAHKAAIGDVLHAIVSDEDNPELLAALTSEALSEGKKNESEKLMAFKDMRAMPSVEADEASVDTRWNALKTARAAEFAADPVALANEFRTNETASYKKSLESKGGGFWALLLAAFREDFLKKKTFA